MSSDVSTRPTAPQPWPFGKPGTGMFRNDRSRLENEVNLRSCGLLHPRAAEFHTETLQGLDPVEIMTYPVYRETYALVAEHLGVDPGSLVLTAGSDPALDLIVRSFPLARIVIHTPNFGGWAKFAHIGKQTIDHVAPDPDSGGFRLADLLTALRKGPRAIVVVTQPHSYTGQVHDAQELTDLARGVGEHGSLLVLDTAYLAFTHGGEELVRGVAGQPHVLRVNGFSKGYGLSGARIAAVVGHPRTVNRVFDLDPEAAVSGIAMALLRAALRHDEYFQAIRDEIRHLRERFARLVESAVPGWRARESGGNFVAFDVPDPAQARAATSRLLRHGFITRDMSGLPSLPAAVRIAVADEPSALRVVDILGDWSSGR
ncbi:aminotransferase class I/II-fold pyridoxal phosphate-dependent enzyme [Streptomyces sp. NPDC001339]|uniref:aminotransferase class I/II-fold pyridoxal phosphate-dependent enzyme n=1 Tax=Streptomyces sp. NPDC001339 TaxID=3364563 RepID=UPI00369017D1